MTNNLLLVKYKCKQFGRQVERSPELLQKALSFYKMRQKILPGSLGIFLFTKNAKVAIRCLLCDLAKIHAIIIPWRVGGAVTQRSAKPRRPVQLWYAPPHQDSRASGGIGIRGRLKICFLYRIMGSSPISPTNKLCLPSGIFCLYIMLMLK